MKGIIIAVLLLCSVAMAQTSQDWSGIGVGASVTMAQGSIDKDWKLEFGRVTKIYTPIESYLIPQAQYNAKTGVVGVGAGILTVLKRLSWGTFLAGGSVIPIEATTTEAIQDNNTATGSLEIAFTRPWKESFPFIKIKQEWVSQVGDSSPLQDKGIKSTNIMLGVVF